MRIIYPSPFNKLAVFILYGLLSVAVITLAQETTPPPSTMSPPCPDKPISPKEQLIIGYIRFKTPNTLNVKDIRWDRYNYINVVAYPKIPATPWNDIHPPPDRVSLSDLKSIVDTRNSKNPDVKVFLSIRNFIPSNWPDDAEGYSKITKETIDTIDNFDLDGVDIEYPGMRGLSCKGAKQVDDENGNNGGFPQLYGKLWDAERDKEFVTFLNDLHGQLKSKDKTLILTVGKDKVTGLNSGHIDLLNIETYHYSLYQDTNNPQPGGKVKSNPNAPIYEYDSAFKTWNGAGIENEKIIMGIDLGNTFQVVDNPAINTTQTVVTADIATTLGLEIINYCPIVLDNDVGDTLALYLYPWNILTDETNATALNDKCYKFNGWSYQFDVKGGTPWLFRVDLAMPANFDYVSYEDFTSINRKLGYAASKSIKGISISDITYDNDDDQNSLVGYMQKIREAPTSDGTPDPTGNNGNPSSSSEIPTNTNQPPAGNKDDKNRGGKIAGGVIGGIFGIIIISGAGFILYRRSQGKPFNLYNKKFDNTSAYVNQHQPGMPTEGSPRMVNQTAIIPVASGYVTAMFDFTGKEENDLSFKKGDKIEVLERGDGPNDWWVGRVNGAVGEFPGNYVKE